MATESFFISEVVDLLGLERDPKGVRGTSFNCRCPFCISQEGKYHLNIDVAKNAYRCVKCCTAGGVLDLYGRIVLNEPYEKGRNGKKLYHQLAIALGENRVEPVHKVIAKGIEYEAILPAKDSDLHSTYSALLRLPELALSDEHREKLEKRGLSEQSIKDGGYATLPNTYEWINRSPSSFLRYESVRLLHETDSALKRYTKEQMIAGIIIATRLLNKGERLENIPGFFQLGDIWCFRYDPGMLVPTRNHFGEIVGLQVRKDQGTLRYMTISSKGLDKGVTERISRIHFPINNDPIDKGTIVMLTEGPLKSDVALQLIKEQNPNGRYAFIAIQGVNNRNGLKTVMKWLKKSGVTTIYNALDMDKITNVNVMKASRQIRNLVEESGLKMAQYLWDEESAVKVYDELKATAQKANIVIPNEGKNMFVNVAKLASTLSSNGVYYLVRNQKIHYWPDRTKGIDDYLVSMQSV